MIYTFVNISEVKFSINGRELYKTFIPLYINDDFIKVLNVYDSLCPLVPKTAVANFIVDGVTYANATDLNNAIYTVIFSKNASEAVSNAQIELNRLAIIDLQNNKSNVGHNHDDRYYTKAQIDILIDDIVSQSDLLAKGEVDGDILNFRQADNTLVFSINAATFTSQGTDVSFSNGVLTLRNSKGEVLSTTLIETGLERSYIEIEGNKFEYIPNFGSDGSTFQTGDIAINGRIDASTYGKLLMYTGGLPSLFASWKTIEKL